MGSPIQPIHSPKHDYVKHLAFSIAIGILSAGGAIIFRSLIEVFQFFFWGHSGNFFETVQNAPILMIIAIPSGCGLVAGLIITYWAPEVKGPGVPEVIVSVTSRESAMRHRVTFFKTFVTSMLIGGGASVGREGPIVQIGASVGSSLAQFFKLNPNIRRVCVASGAAAGISATFNAPIAATLFALEIILMDIELPNISHIVSASVIASVFSRLFWGEFRSFHVPGFQIVSYWELAIYLLLGIMAGFLSIGFVKSIFTVDQVFRRIKRLPDWSKPCIGGLLLGILGVYFPQVLGVGYHLVDSGLTVTIGLQLALLMLLTKVLATSISIGSGMSGGIFAPSLVLGSVLGVICGITAIRLFPEAGIFPGSYALAGMGAVVAGTTLAPMTAIVTIFELTYNDQTILPLMVACITSVVIVRHFFGYSAYEMKLIAQGINIVRGHDVAILRSLRVKDFMDPKFETMRNSTPLQAIVRQFNASHFPHFIVTDAKGEMEGMLSLRDLREVTDKYEELKNIVIADDMMSRLVVTLFPHDNMESALYLFDIHHFSCLPVVDPKNPRNVLGLLKKDVFLLAYKEKVLKNRLLSKF